MKTPLTLASLILTCASASAGTLSNGNWAPIGCGSKPKAPDIFSRDESAFNKSVEAVNTWQEQSKVYFDCMIKEANADNTAIADSANKEQAQYRETIEKIKTEIDAASKKLDQ